MTVSACCFGSFHGFHADATKEPKKNAGTDVDGPTTQKSGTENSGIIRSTPSTSFSFWTPPNPVHFTCLRRPAFATAQGSTSSVSAIALNKIPFGDTWRLERDRCPLNILKSNGSRQGVHYEPKSSCTASNTTIDGLYLKAPGAKVSASARFAREDSRI